MPHRMGMFLSALVIAVLIAAPAAGQAKPAKPAAAPPPLFTTALTLEQMRGKQAVIDTTAGRVVLELLPDKAPNHVGYFLKLAQEGAYNGTTFHRLIKHGIIQGGDPLSKDPAKVAQYGTGGLKMLAFEPGAGSHGRGAVSGVLVPGNRDSAGSQFFICVTPQPSLDGQYTVFARVVEGIGIVTQISEAPVDAAGKATERIEMTSVTIRDAPPAGVVPFRRNPRPNWPRSARCSKRVWATSPSSSCRRRRQTTCGTSCVWPPRACTTGPRFTAWCPGS